MKSKVGAAAVNWQVKNAVELQQQERGGSISFVAAMEENLSSSQQCLQVGLPSKDD